MNEFIPGFKGVSLTGYGVEVKEGKHVSAPQGEYVELAHGQEYSLEIINFNTHVCRVNLNIDGYDQGSWQLDAQRIANIERPVKVAKKFTFFRADAAPKRSGIAAGRSENGLVTCTFTPVVKAPTVNFILNVPCHTPPMSSSRLCVFGKHGTRDLAKKITDLLTSKYHMGDLSEYDVIQWQSNRPTSRIENLLNLEQQKEDTDSFIPYREGCEYYIDCIPKIRSVRIQYNDDVFHHNMLSAPTLGDIFRLVGKLDLPKFCLCTAQGRLFHMSQWQVWDGNSLNSFLRKDEITEAARSGILHINVLDERPGSEGDFNVAVKTLTGTTIPLLINDAMSIHYLKYLIQIEEGIPTDQQRLVAGGLQLENDFDVSHYPAIQESGVMHLVLRLRGGGMDPSFEIKAGDIALEDASAEKKMLNAPDSNWTAGATTLGKESNQTFQKARALNYDHSKATKLVLRLVARADEEVANMAVDDVEFTPLSSAVPPPVGHQPSSDVPSTAAHTSDTTSTTGTSASGETHEENARAGWKKKRKKWGCLIM